MATKTLPSRIVTPSIAPDWLSGVLPSGPGTEASAARMSSLLSMMRIDPRTRAPSWRGPSLFAPAMNQIAAGRKRRPFNALTTFHIPATQGD